MIWILCATSWPFDPEKKLNSYGKGKYLLRKAFEGDWLPPEILWREKAAFSDACGPQHGG